MALQLDGLAAILQGGRLRVSDGSQQADAALNDGFPRVQDGVVEVQATFGEQEANFEWRERTVLTAAGVALDVEADDHGRKAPGAVWTLTTTLEAAPDG